MSAGGKKSGYARVDATDDEDSSGPKKIGGGEGTSTNWFARWSFWWVNPAITAGYRGEVLEEQLWDLAEQDTLEDCTSRLLAAWDKATVGLSPADIERDAEKAAKGEGAPVWEMPFGKAMWTVHGPQYKKWLGIKILNDFNQTLPAILLNKILLFLQDETAQPMDGFVLVLTAFVMMMLKTFAENVFFYQVRHQRDDATAVCSTCIPSLDPVPPCCPDDPDLHQDQGLHHRGGLPQGAAAHARGQIAPHRGRDRQPHAAGLGAADVVHPDVAGESRPTAAVSMENPYCSCKLTRVSVAAAAALRHAADRAERLPAVLLHRHLKRRRDPDALLAHPDQPRARRDAGAAPKG